MLLANLYSDKTHFIYELIQNAEDACARSRKRGDTREYYISFQLFDDRLECRHNGIEFNEDDVKGICSIASGTKKEDQKQIGKFGIGFKSVYAYTNSPEIYSMDKYFCIKDYVHPYAIEKRALESDETLFVISFNNGKVRAEEAFEDIKEKLEHLGLRTLLFLKNINTIKWKAGESHGIYLRKPEKHKSNYIELSLRQGEVEKENEKWLVFSKPISETDDEVNAVIEVAYLVKEDSKNNTKSITPVNNTALVVFFKTQKETNLRFLIQGPYNTTPARDNIYTNEWNKKLILETATFVAETIVIVKEMNLLNISFLETLPIQNELFPKENVFRPIYDAILNKLRSNADLLPCSNMDYTTSGNAAISRTEELRKLLTSQQLRILFGEKHNKWLDGNITIDKTRELRDYLMQELGIPEITPERFVQSLSEEFLNEQEDNWIINLYQFLAGQKALFGILKSKPIFRLQNNKQTIAYDKLGRPLVYLPIEADSSYPILKRNLAEDKEASEFLKMFGLEKPDIFAEIREVIIPKYKQSNNSKNEHYFEDFERILNGYSTISLDKKSKFLEQLTSSYFIDAINSKGIHRMCKPSEIYQSTTDLKTYFKNSDSTYFVSDELYKIVDNKKLSALLVDLGIEDKPRLIETKANLNDKEKIKLRGKEGWTRDISQRDYKYDGLGNFLNKPDPQKSYLIWRLLLKSIENKKEFEARKFFKGNYTWFYYSNHEREFDARFLKFLKTQSWLVDKNNNLKRPNDINFGELSNEYVKVGNNINILIEALGVSKFDNDTVKQLPLEDRKKLELTKGYSSDQLKEILEKSGLLKSVDEEAKGISEVWAPRYMPDAVAPKIEKISLEKIITPDLGGQSEELTEKRKENKITENNSDDEGIGPLSYTDKKAIGDWGEKYVYRTLMEEYRKFGAVTETEFGFKADKGIEIVWLNKNGNVGKGFDFIIKRNNIELKYIEVKTTKTEGEELIEISGVQWEFARKLYDKNEGNKYFIYVVPNAGEPTAKIIEIEDPVKLWKEGKLYAHPVNFKLPPSNVNKPA